MRIAFYAPLKSPAHGTPSGDRRIAALLMDALGRAGHFVELASSFRSYEPAGDAARQSALREEGVALGRQLGARWRALAPALRPELWFTYHLYYKAPDWLGPEASAALGIPYPDPDERVLGEADLEAARRVKAFLDAGLPEEGIVQVARAIGMGTARIADANRELIRRTLMQPGDTERDLALRFAAAAEHMLPIFEPTLLYAQRAHLLEQVRRDVIGAADLEAGEMGATTEVSVCFADLVGFTKLGEEIAPEELGAVAERLEELATAAAEPPVRLVKTIGDAAMLVSPDAVAMIAAALALVEAFDGEEDLPLLRAGIARGPALLQIGDYYGRPVNLASRITAVARPSSVLVDKAARDAAPDAFHYSFAGERRLKGFDAPATLYRARRRLGLNA